MTVQFPNRLTGQVIFQYGDEDYYDAREALQIAIDQGVNLSAAQLEGAMGEVNFDDMDFTRAKVRMASFNGSSLKRARFAPGQNLYQCLMVGCDLTETVLSKTIMCGVDASGSLLYGTFLNGADLRHGRVVYAQLDGAQCVGTILDFVNFDHATALTGPNLTKAFARTAYFRETQFPLAIISGADFSGAIWVPGQPGSNVGGLTGA